MALLASKTGGGDFKLAPAGQYAAICYQVIDLGSQFSEKYQKWQRKVRIAFEMHGENQIGDGYATMDDGKPFTIGSTYTLSLSDNAALRGLLECWRGRPFTTEEEDGFDIGKLVGVPCMLTIQHEPYNGKEYANIKQASPLLKSITKPTQVNDTTYYELDPWKQKEFEALPEWLRAQIKESKEYKDMFMAGAPANTTNGAPKSEEPFDDEIPF